MLPEYRNSVAFRNIPRLRQFVLVRTTCRWRWVWSTGGMVLTAQTEWYWQRKPNGTDSTNRSTGTETCHSGTLLTTNPTCTGLGSNTGLRGEIQPPFSYLNIYLQTWGTQLPSDSSGLLLLTWGFIRRHNGFEFLRTDTTERSPQLTNNTKTTEPAPRKTTVSSGEPIHSRRFLCFCLPSNNRVIYRGVWGGGEIPNAYKNRHSKEREKK
jgi:hypothetical protein